MRDCYKEIISLPFDGIGLDFVEGKKTAELIEKNGFPEEKLLFAGIVNGKNVWRSDYSEKLKILDEVKKKTKNISRSFLKITYNQLEGIR